jgi:hypothetical protein
MTIAPRQFVLALALTVPLAAIFLAGCRVDTHKNGNNDNVDIGTPFGSMHVKTNDAANPSAIGLAVYPGAVPVKDHDGKDDDAADVNMSFGSFHFGVRVASFQTSDPVDKVLAFYRKDLARYGDVIECRGGNPVGQPTRTSLGLTCNDSNQHQHIDTDSKVELRAGSEQRQHIVGLHPTGGGTRIGLVALDRPSHLSGHDGKDVE